MRTTQLSFILILLLNTIGYADNINSSKPKHRQESATKDSLFQIIKTTKTPELKTKAFISLGKIYQSNNIDSSSYYLKRALKLSKKAKLKKLEAESYSQLGILYYYTAQYTNAINYMKDAVDLFKSINDSSKVSDLLNNIGLVYTTINKNDYAIDYLQQSVEIKKALHDEYNTALAYLNIGAIYMNMKKDSIAMIYMLKALPTFENGLQTSDSLNAMSGMAYSYNNIGQIYQNKGEYAKALIYLKKTIKYLQTIDDISNLTLSFVNIASIGLDIAKTKSGNSKVKYLKSIKTYIDSAIYNANKVQDYNNLFLAFNILSEYYFELGDFKNAYKYKNEYITLKDSIFDKQKMSEIEGSEERYHNLLKQAELDKNEIELNKNNEIIKKQNQLIKMGAIALVVVTILVFLIIIYLRKNKKKSKVLLLKNKEIEYINKNLNDSLKIASFIQNVVLSEFKNKDDFFEGFFTINKPKELVGGDFTWKKSIDNHIYIAVADCIGHGIPGAMVSMISNNFLHYSIKYDKLNKDLGDILTQLRNEGIKKVIQRDIFSAIIGLDLALIKFNRINYELEYAGANLPIYIITEHELSIEKDKYKLYQILNNKKKLYEIRQDRMPLGNYEILDDFVSVKFRLNKGDQLYMFSDGFADQFGGEYNKKFKYRYFKDLILSTSDKNITEQGKIIDTTFTNWIGNNEQIDDVTVLALEI